MRACRVSALAALAVITAGWTSAPESPGAPVAQPGAGASESGVAVASNANNGVLTAFECTRRGDSRSDICVVRFDSGGEKIDLDGKIVSSLASTNVDPTVACASASCVIGWSSVGEAIYAARMDFMTGVVQPPQRLFDLEGTADRSLSIAVREGGDFMALDATSTALYTLPLTVSLVPAGPQTNVFTSSGVMRSTSLVSGLDTALACFQELVGIVHTLRCLLLDPLGQPLGSAFNVGLLTPDSLATAHATVWDGQSYGVAYISDDHQLAYLSFDETGARSLISILVDTSDLGPAPSLSFDSVAGDVVIGWIDSSLNVNLGRIAAGQQTFEYPVVRVDQVSNIDAMTATSATGDAVVVTLESLSLPLGLLKAESVGTFDGGGFTLAMPGATPLLSGPQADYFPQAAWTGSGWLTSWLAFGGGASTLWTRATDTLGVPLGAPVVRTEPSLLVWDAAPGAFDGQGLVVFNDVAASTVDWASFDPGDVSMPVEHPLAVVSERAPTTAVTFGDTELAVWAGTLDAGWSIFSVVLPTDGGASGVPQNLLALPGVAHSVAAAASRSQLFIAAATETGVYWPGANPSAVNAQRVSVASDGVDFVVVWDEGFSTDRVRAVRIAADGGTLDSAPIEIMAETTRDAELNARPSVAFDGHAYRIAWELNSDAGADIWWRRLWPDGGLGEPELLVASPQVDEQVSLTAGDPGRILVQWRQYEPAALTMRARQMVWAEIDEGGACTVDDECVGGVCGSGTCVGDGGTPTPDGGVSSMDAGLQTDGGAPIAHGYAVGCGCSTPSGAAMVMALLMLLKWPVRRRVQARLALKRT